MLSDTHELQCLIMSPAAAATMSFSISAAFLSDSFHCYILINCLASTVKRIKKKNKGSKISETGEGGRDVGGELAAARMSASTGLVHCRQGPPALPPLLSAGSAAAKKWLNKALFICADCIHCTSQLRGSGTTQICPALERKGPADWSSITVCTEVPG